MIQRVISDKYKYNAKHLTEEKSCQTTVIYYQLFQWAN